ncbi:MAG TPA: NUDIX domain-containing protein [Gemmataceae bacterium]|nr:NUDIX domain-containing protein [Gemmataceae bacterium]
MRQSQGSFALVRRPGRGGTEYLVQWNAKWRALNLVGGHRRPDESFRDCVCRELAEELGLRSGAGARVAGLPCAHREYTDFSDSAGEETAYTMELFEVGLTPAAERQVSADPQNAWVSEAEVRAGRADDDRPISRTTGRLVLECPARAHTDPGVPRPMFWQRTRDVIAAVVYDPDRGFLLAHNEKWGAYAFPMRKRRPTDHDDAFTAREALREALALPLPRAEAKPLEHVVYRGTSWRTGREGVYRYQAFEVDPGEALPAGGFGRRHGFLRTDDLVGADLVTWSTKLIVKELMENQEVALAVLCRPGAEGREFLMVRSPTYRGYFFPASRLTSDDPPLWEAVSALRRDTGYFAPIRGGTAAVVPDIHFSPRFDCPRRFVFHVVPVTLPAVDLSATANTLEETLRRTGVLWRWVEEAELADPSRNGLSPTVAAVREAALRVCQDGRQSREP